MSQREIELNINEIVLDGFDIKDQYRFGMALQNELQRLVTERGMPAALSKGAVIPGLNGEMNHHAGVEAVASHVANTVYTGLGGNK